MKKSLTIISFAFIFLLTLSVVSVSAGLWITGDVQRSTAVESGGLAQSVRVSDADGGTTFSRTSGVSASARKSQAPECPRGNVWFKTKDVNGNDCCQRKAGSERSGLFSRR